MQLSNGCHTNRDKFHRSVRPYDAAVHCLRRMPQVLFQTEQDRAQRWQFLSSKVHPRKGQEVPEGEYRYRSTLSLTSALGGCTSSTPRPGRFIPGKDPLPIVQEAGWAPGPVWTDAENLAPPGSDSRTRSEWLYRLRYPGPLLAEPLRQINCNRRTCRCCRSRALLRLLHRQVGSVQTRDFHEPQHIPNLPAQLVANKSNYLTATA